MPGLIEQIKECRNLIAEAERLSKIIQNENIKLRNELTKLIGNDQSSTKENKDV